MSDVINLTSKIPQQLAGCRLDKACSKLFSNYSRTKLSEWIKNGNLLVNDNYSFVRYAVKTDDVLQLNAKLEQECNYAAQNIKLNIVFEDDHILVINKPAGLIVHPGAGNPDNTILNALLHYNPQFNLLPRAGIVHRLDKDTTGLMVVAKTLEAQTSLVNQLQTHQVARVYHALIIGTPISGAKIDAPIARHPHNRQKMAVVAGGKNAISYFKILRRFCAHTYVEVKLETGRTHQIRVHMSNLGYPLIGDKLYGAKLKLPKNASLELSEYLRDFPRQALHAKELSLIHPHFKKLISFNCELPSDLIKLINLLDNKDS